MSTPLQVDVIEQFRARFGTSPGSQDHQTERRQWEQICADLLKERGAMQEQMNRLREERDRCMQALLALMPLDPEIAKLTKEEILSQAEEMPSWEELLAEIGQYPEK